MYVVAAVVCWSRSAMDVVNRAVNRLYNQDMDGLLAMCAEDVDWWVMGKEAGIPWAGGFKGKPGVKEYMQLFDKHAKLEGYVVEELFTDKEDGLVTVIVRCDIARKTADGGADLTGRGIAVVPSASVWAVDKHEHIVKYEEYLDTWLVAEILKRPSGAAQARAGS
ncbi:hypothetical protein WJX72_000164 [[Myrmecia] bisecta]|uniref:SnoaL-like domain-containing protein n=1 Tax=[Myrmecia] bisecta TaxID=41462 RepID=A0AAW1R421_9CHLO